MNNLPMPSSKILQAGVSSATGTEVIRDMGFLKKYKAAEPKGLHPSYDKDGGEVLTSELTKLMGCLNKGSDSQGMA